MLAITLSASINNSSVPPPIKPPPLEGRFVKLAPLIAGSGSGNAAAGIVPEVKLDAFKFDKFAPLVAGSVAGNLAFGIVPVFKFEASPAVKPPEVPVVFWLRVSTENVVPFSDKPDPAL